MLGLPPHRQGLGACLTSPLFQVLASGQSEHLCSASILDLETPPRRWLGWGDSTCLRLTIPHLTSHAPLSLANTLSKRNFLPLPRISKGGLGEVHPSVPPVGKFRNHHSLLKPLSYTDDCQLIISYKKTYSLLEYEPSSHTRGGVCVCVCAFHWSSINM